MTNPNELDFSDINETNAPRTLGELHELTEGRPLSQEQFRHVMDVGSKRTANEEKNPASAVPEGMANPNLGDLELQVNSQHVGCDNCGTPIPRDQHKEEGGLCYECWKDNQDEDRHE
jgi:hypothetical protein